MSAAADKPGAKFVPGRDVLLAVKVRSAAGVKIVRESIVLPKDTMARVRMLLDLPDELEFQRAVSVKTDRKETLPRDREHEVTVESWAKRLKPRADGLPRMSAVVAPPLPGMCKDLQDKLRRLGAWAQRQGAVAWSGTCSAVKASWKALQKLIGQVADFGSRVINIADEWNGKYADVRASKRLVMAAAGGGAAEELPERTELHERVEALAKAADALVTAVGNACSDPLTAKSLAHLSELATDFSRMAISLQTQLTGALAEAERHVAVVEEARSGHSTTVAMAGGGLLIGGGVASIVAVATATVCPPVGIAVLGVGGGIVGIIGGAGIGWTAWSHSSRMKEEARIAAATLAALTADRAMVAQAITAVDVAMGALHAAGAPAADPEAAHDTDGDGGGAAAAPTTTAHADTGGAGIRGSPTGYTIATAIATATPE